ncbi:MAG: FAD-dependent oxidoreductase, partial [Clostridia bacterium]|nr:FAD-dependent oxidoreductase [Clostridia bacterium]
MKDYNCCVVVVGGGPACLAAAISAKKNGAKNVIVVERENRLGGILKQYIHAGFGLQYFGEELTGPEYAEKFAVLAKKEGIEFMLNTTDLEIKEKTLFCV